MLDVKSLEPKQIEMLTRFMNQSVAIQSDICELIDAMEDTAREVAVELNMGSDGANILLAAARKAFEKHYLKPPGEDTDTVDDIIKACGES